MSQLSEENNLDANLIKKLNKTKQNRIKAEEQAKMLKNKIYCLKQKEKTSDTKIKKFKALTLKITKCRENKVEDIERSETHRKADKDAAVLQKKFNQEALYKSQRHKEENLERIYQQNREEYKEIKDRQKFEEFLLNQEYLKKIQENSSIKCVLKNYKENSLRENYKLKEMKFMECQKLYGKRINDEKDMIINKRIEKEIMRDTDFAVIEYLQAGNFDQGKKRNKTLNLKHTI